MTTLPSMNAGGKEFSQSDMDRLEAIYRSGDDTQLTKAEQAVITVMDRRETARALVETCYRVYGMDATAERELGGLVKGLGIADHADNATVQTVGYLIALNSLLERPTALKTVVRVLHNELLACTPDIGILADVLGRAD